MRFREIGIKIKEHLGVFRAHFQKPLLCSDCFKDRGLTLEAQKIGRPSDAVCPNCRSRTGAKLFESTIPELARIFFIHGSFIKTEFGGASPLRFGKGDVEFAPWLEPDVRLLKEKCEISLRHYGPPTWRVGEVGPLKKLRDTTTREAAAADVVRRFPRRTFEAGETFYRLRKATRGRFRTSLPGGFGHQPPASLTGREVLTGLG
jgi:hypothetical protein